MDHGHVLLHRIETAVPDASYTQEDALQFMVRLLGDTQQKRDFLKKIYHHSAVHKRHMVLKEFARGASSLARLAPREIPLPTSKQRNDLYIQESKRLAVEAVRRLLERLPDGISNKITHVITVSCTGMSAPGFDFHVVKELRLPVTVDRTHIGFMGCCAAFPALKLARSICLADRNARVLIVNVELCSLHVQKVFEPDTVVAGAIFSDGASAALASARKEDSSGSRFLLHGFHSELLPDSQDEMTWTIGESGFDMRLSSYVPRLIEANLLAAMERLFRQAGVVRDAIGLWAIHPGGRAILEKVQQALGLSAKDLQPSYDVLREYGNMSSSTIMFVLQRILKNAAKGKVFAAAFGPGLTLEFGYLEKT